MEKKRITIDESNLKPDNFQALMFDLIDFLIKNYQIQSLREWEQDHSISDQNWQEKITALNSMKYNLKEEFRDALDTDLLLDLKFSVEVSPRP